MSGLCHIILCDGVCVCVCLGGVGMGGGGGSWSSFFTLSLEIGMIWTEICLKEPLNPKQPTDQFFVHWPLISG